MPLRNFPSGPMVKIMQGPWFPSLVRELDFATKDLTCCNWGSCILQLRPGAVKWINKFKFHSVAQSCLTLQPHGLQHARLPCPSPTPGACSNSCLLSQWCPPTILSSVVPFSFCLPSFPASGSFPMSQFFASGSQSNLNFNKIHQSFCVYQWLVPFYGWVVCHCVDVLQFIYPSTLWRAFGLFPVTDNYE